MKNIHYFMSRIRIALIMLCSIVVFSCQKEPEEVKIIYNDSIYSLRTYKVERHPTTVRNGFGMDIYHLSNSGFDTMYFSNKLPAWHPNNPSASGYILKKYSEELSDSIEFDYDLLFFNELAYTQNYAGDYSGSGYPVIFLYTNPIDDSKSTKAVMVGQGLTCFDGFTADSITDKRIASLTTDPLINLPSLRIMLNTNSVTGLVLLADSVVNLFPSLAIGNKFRPNIGGIFNIADASDVNQINYQPVFLVKTRESLFAKFMVTRFKGIGEDVQKLTLIWQAINK
jgi:hypothetical protein